MTTIPHIGGAAVKEISKRTFKTTKDMTTVELVSQTCMPFGGRRNTQESTTPATNHKIKPPHHPTTPPSRRHQHPPQATSTGRVPSQQSINTIGSGPSRTDSAVSPKLRPKDPRPNIHTTHWLSFLLASVTDPAEAGAGMPAPTTAAPTKAAPILPRASERVQAADSPSPPATLILVVADAAAVVPAGAVATLLDVERRSHRMRVRETETGRHTDPQTDIKSC